MSGPEDNPADDEPIDREAWEACDSEYASLCDTTPVAAAEPSDAAEYRPIQARYTADQMRNYARTTLATPVAAAEPSEPLREVIERTIEVIERQLNLIAERASGNYLDKRPVVSAYKAHIQRLRKVLALRTAGSNS